MSECLGMKGEVELSVRLRSLAELVTAGNCVCDVGCDHGFLSIYLVQKKIAPKAIAMDLREGPLSRAREHIRDWGLEDYIETRLSDGVEALEPGEAQSLVCAGMGGRLMRKILTEGREKCEKLRELILQPQSEVKEFRAFLRREGYRIAEEKMVEEDGKFYFLMKAIPGKGLASERALYDAFGEQLLLRKDPVLRRFLFSRKGALEEILEQLEGQAGEKALLRKREIERELEEIREALRYFREEVLT